MKLQWQWIALAALSAGCGTGIDLCDRASVVELGLLDKAKACTNVSLTLMSRATCEQSFKSCNSNDQQLLSSYLDCLERSVGTCVPGQENIYSGSIALCNGLATGITATCKAAGLGPQ